jgi:hypothetical protein
MLLCHFGDMPSETVRYNASRFINEVAPKLRDKFADWEDRWSPQTARVPA